jgi:hypothetical protein
MISLVLVAVSIINFPNIIFRKQILSAKSYALFLMGFSNKREKNGAYNKEKWDFLTL